MFGESGSGKTTLVDLLSGFLKPDKGKILCDENDISNLIIGWRKLIGYVLQSIFIIDDTIKNNICLGLADNEIDESSLKYSIDKSQLEKLINSLPEGYNSLVGDKGIVIIRTNTKDWYCSSSVLAKPIIISMSSQVH